VFFAVMGKRYGLAKANTGVNKREELGECGPIRASKKKVRINSQKLGWYMLTKLHEQTHNHTKSNPSRDKDATVKLFQNTQLAKYRKNHAGTAMVVASPCLT
jgi:hypothetical protein